MCDPTIKRYLAYETIPEALKDFMNTVTHYDQLSRTKEPAYDHITNEDKLRVGELCIQAKDFLI